MKAIIIAAGMGIRLNPLTNDKPKCMPETGSKTIMQRQLEVLRYCGINNIITTSGCETNLALKGDTRNDKH
jgi:choline kinase